MAEHPAAVSEHAAGHGAGGEAAVPLWPGLLTEGSDGTPRLAGTRCQACGACFFPRRLVCARCLSSNLATVALSTRGALYTYTIVHQSTPEFPTPYVLAYVDLPEGVRLLAPLAASRDDLRIGTPLELRVEAVRTDAAGRPVLGYRAYSAVEVTHG